MRDGRLTFPGLAGKKILLVEDEAMLALDIKLHLERFEVQVIGPAYSLYKAIEIYEAAKRVDGAILDINLNGTDVYPLADQLVSDGIPIVFHSGNLDFERLEAEYPKAEMCPKPMLRTDLFSQLERLLRIWH
jgi:CheY-like chemotaxis protein